MTTLCRFCRSEDGPNPATTTIEIAGGRELPACIPCYREYQQEAYEHWKAERQYEESLARQYEDDYPNYFDHGSVGPDPRDSSLIDEAIRRGL